MNRTFFVCVYLAVVAAFMSCSKSEVNIPDHQESVPASISHLRKVTLREDLNFGTTAIKGVVVSDTEGKNIPANVLAVQEEGKDAAVLIELAEPVSFTFGAEVEIDLRGSRLVEEQGELRVKDLKASSVKATGRTVAIAPKSTSLSSVAAEAKYWGPILVRLENLTLTGGEAGNMHGEVTISDGIASLYANFSAESVFSQEPAPEIAQTFIGIVRVEGDKVYVNPGNPGDVLAEARETVEDFEGPSNTSYDVKSIAFKTGSWIVDGGITATSTADLKTGAQCIRLQGTTTNAKRKGILAMEFDLQGVKNLRVSHGIYPAAAETSNVNPTTFDVQVSRDGGVTYTTLKQVEVDIKSTALITDVVEVKAGKNEQVRFRIVNSSTPFANNNLPRINLDDIVFEY